MYKLYLEFDSKYSKQITLIINETKVNIIDLTNLILSHKLNEILSKVLE